MLRPRPGEAVPIAVRSAPRLHQAGPLRDDDPMSSGPGASLAAAQAGRSQHLCDLLTRVATGDREAFAALYDETAALVHGLAQRVVRDPDLAADVTQDVMIEVWRIAPRFDPNRGSVMAWLATLARRRAVDRVRSEQSDRNRRDAAATRDYQRPFDEVAELAEGHADAAAVRRCLARLTALQRDAVTSAFFGGLTYREVAERTGAALPTVKSRIRDGLHGLRRCLTSGPQTRAHPPAHPDEEEA